MALSDTEIANLAIANIGIAKEIQNLETDSTNEARACRRFFAIARNAVLKDFDWNFATKTAPLNLVEECPDNEWAYSYRYPSDCQFFRRIQPTGRSGEDETFVLPGTRPAKIGRRGRNETRQSRVSFRIVSDDTARLIYTDEPDAIGEYTKRITDTCFFTDDFTLAFSFRLAMYIAPLITKGDGQAQKASMAQQYALEISMAEANALNEEQPDENPDSEFIRTRE